MDELFIDTNKLPEVLNDKDIYELFLKINEGDENAREKIIRHNIKLVLFLVNNNFNVDWNEKKELVAIGNIGLLKAVDSFDISKKLKFSTYASKCINNEILMYLRKNIKDKNIQSNNKLFYNNDGKIAFKIEELICDDTDIVDNYIENETYVFVRNIIENLSEREKEVIKMKFGFYDKKEYTHTEIGNKINLSSSHVSRLLDNILGQIQNQLELNGFFERIERKNSRISNSKKFKTIYDFFSEYTKKQVNEVLVLLTENEKKLIKLRFGEYLDNPIDKLTLSNNDYYKLHNILIPKIKKILEIFNKKINDNFYSYNENNITKEDYIKLIELLRNSYFSNFVNQLTFIEYIIIVLKLGYINNKFFSTSSIAHFLEIEQMEVLNVTNKFLQTNDKDIILKKKKKLLDN